jgi:hypothetical protein
MSHEFPVQNGVKQYALSPLLFIALEYTTSKVQENQE